VYLLNCLMHEKYYYWSCFASCSCSSSRRTDTAVLDASFQVVGVGCRGDSDGGMVNSSQCETSSISHDDPHNVLKSIEVDGTSAR
jgi:hypothetical protein